MTNQRSVLAAARRELLGLSGHVFDVFTVAKPVSVAAAVNLAKVISKLSPLVGNLIEFNAIEILNRIETLRKDGVWERQDPGFPDAIFRSDLRPEPGIEIKAWFPLSTEITARFRDSQRRFAGENIDVALIAWVPEAVICGKPRIIDVCVVSGLSVAKARDKHYFNPPDYLVVEPEDTTARTSNLQQTNTAGYKWQGRKKQFLEAVRLVKRWGARASEYDGSEEQQRRVRNLLARYPYRLDTNFAKMDRIVHDEIEEFKTRVLAADLRGMSVQQWSQLLAGEDETAVAEALRDRLGITGADAGGLIA